MSAVVPTRPVPPTHDAVPHLHERCEDPRCTVGPDGIAECGRIACPLCGAGGESLSVPAGLGGLVRCTCGTVFDPGR